MAIGLAVKVSYVQRLFLDLGHLLVRVGARLPLLPGTLLWLARTLVMSVVVFAVSVVMLTRTSSSLTTSSASRSSCAIVDF